MTFRVGMKVVCIARAPVPPSQRKYKDEIQPSVGGIYTIRAILDHSVLLDEIINQHHKYTEWHGEVAFLASRFRPIVERKTDISIFTRMLTDQKVEA